MKLFYPLAIVLILWAALPAGAVDQVTRGGGQVFGTIESMTPTKIVVVNNTTKKSEEIPVNIIESIRFDGEPPVMNLLRADVRSGNYRAAAEKLDGLEAGSPNARVKDELTYYRAFVTAKQALGSGVREQMQKGGKALSDYVAQNPGSWHLYEAVEVIGDLYAALAAVSPDADKKIAYELADKEYQKLAAAPWDDYKLKATVARARAFQQAGQGQQAKQLYQDAIRLGTAKGAKDAAAAPLVLAARVGLADVIAESSPQEAIKLITEVVAGADPENTRLHAMAFLTLGKCHNKAGNTKEALMNFLKVDVLYFAQADCHAESLFYLSGLWNTVNRPDRAKETADKLKSRYPNSAFASRVK